MDASRGITGSRYSSGTVAKDTNTARTTAWNEKIIASKTLPPISGKTNENMRDPKKRLATFNIQRVHDVCTQLEITTQALAGEGFYCEKIAPLLPLYKATCWMCNESKSFALWEKGKNLREIHWDLNPTCPALLHYITEEADEKTAQTQNSQSLQNISAHQHRDKKPSTSNTNKRQPLDSHSQWEPIIQQVTDSDTRSSTMSMPSSSRTLEHVSDNSNESALFYLLTKVNQTGIVVISEAQLQTLITELQRLNPNKHINQYSVEDIVSVHLQQQEDLKLQAAASALPAIPELRRTAQQSNTFEMSESSSSSNRAFISMPDNPFLLNTNNILPEAVRENTHATTSYTARPAAVNLNNTADEGISNERCLQYLRDREEDDNEGVVVNVKNRYKTRYHRYPRTEVEFWAEYVSGAADLSDS